MGLAGRVSVRRAFNALRWSTGRSSILPTRASIGAAMAPDLSRCRVGLWADCVNLGWVEPRLGVATAIRRRHPGAKAGAASGSR